MQYGKKLGEIGWLDLTVEHATEVADFYSAVIGWNKEAASMGDYDDYSMTTESGSCVGVCHARGDNAEMPVGWLPYVMVRDVNASVEQVLARGGKVRVGPKTMMGAGFAVIEDPAGAVMGIMGIKENEDSQ